MTIETAVRTGCKLRTLKVNRSPLLKHYEKYYVAAISNVDNMLWIYGRSANCGRHMPTIATKVEMRWIVLLCGILPREDVMFIFLKFGNTIMRSLQHWCPEKVMLLISKCCSSCHRNPHASFIGLYMRCAAPGAAENRRLVQPHRPSPCTSRSKYKFDNVC